MICGEGEEGVVVSGVDGLILLISMKNSEVTGKLPFLKAVQPNLAYDNHETNEVVNDVNPGESTLKSVSSQFSSSAKKFY